MATHPDYPGVSSYKDRHGKERWRFQAKGRKPAAMPDPGSPEFEARYFELTTGHAVKPVVPLPTSALAKTFRHAWNLVRESDEWLGISDESRKQHSMIAERFLAMPVLEDGSHPLKWGDVPVEELTFEDIETLKKRFRRSEKTEGRATPTAPYKLKVVLGKMITEARRKRWRNDNPLELVTFVRGGAPGGKNFGFKPWPQKYQDQFEACHPLGSAARTVYELGKWMGARAGDIAALRFDQEVEVEIEGEWIKGFEFLPDKKTNTDADDAELIQFRPINKMLARALEPLDRSAGFVVISERGVGLPYTHKGSLAEAMKRWCREANIPRGYVLHGLRKVHAVKLAEAKASIKEMMDSLGHLTPAMSIYYARGAEKRRTSTSASRKLEASFDRENAPRLRVVR
jgi:Phage integrase family